MTRGLILAIESSCDETAAAVVERGSRTLSSVVASQIATHARYGGVVPELASREHLRAIVPVVRAALAQANITLSDLDAWLARSWSASPMPRPWPTRKISLSSPSTISRATSTPSSSTSASPLLTVILSNHAILIGFPSYHAILTVFPSE
jgi:hypothetical protein